MNDYEIVEAIRNDHVHALEILVGRYSKYLATVVTAVGGEHLTRQDVEEITADCFISFWKGRDSFVMTSEVLKPYLSATARNTTRNVLAARRIECLPIEEDVISDDCNIEDDFVQREAEAYIKGCIFDLGEPDRTIFTLRYYYFLKTREIAKRMGIKQKTVETRLLRGREKLRVKLIEGGFKDE